MSWFSRSTTARSLGLYVFAFLLALGYLVWTVQAGFRQTTQRVVRQQKFADEPVKIAEMKTGNKLLKTNEAFDGPGDWLRNSKFRLQNQSGQDIIYLELRLFFPETTSTGNVMVYPLELGNMPGTLISREPLLFEAGKEITLNLDDAQYQDLAKFLKIRHDISDLHVVRLQLGMVVFSDETAWQSGFRMKRSPTDPNRWIPANGRE